MQLQNPLLLDKNPTLKDKQLQIEGIYCMQPKSTLSQDSGKQYRLISLSSKQEGNNSIISRSFTNFKRYVQIIKNKLNKSTSILKKRKKKNKKSATISRQKKNTSNLETQDQSRNLNQSCASSTERVTLSDDLVLTKELQIKEKDKLDQQEREENLIQQDKAIDLQANQSQIVKPSQQKVLIKIHKVIKCLNLPKFKNKSKKKAEDKRKKQSKKKKKKGVLSESFQMSSNISKYYYDKEWKNIIYPINDVLKTQSPCKTESQTVSESFIDKKECISSSTSQPLEEQKQQLEAFYFIKEKQIKNFTFKLQQRTYPEKFSTIQFYLNTQQKPVQLYGSEKIQQILKQLDQDIQPIVQKFQLNYECLCENSIESVKAAYTERIPINK